MSKRPQNDGEREIAQYNEDILKQLAQERQTAKNLLEQLQVKESELAAKDIEIGVAVAQALTAKDLEFAQVIAKKDAEWTQKLEAVVCQAKNEANATLSKQARQFSMKMAQYDLNMTQRLHDTFDNVINSKDEAYKTLKVELGIKTKALNDMKVELDNKAKTFDDIKAELENCRDSIILTDTQHKSEIQGLKRELDRHSDLNVKQREDRLIIKFENAYKHHNKRRKIPAYVSYLIQDYIINTCLNDLSSRPLMVSKVALELGHTKLNLQDLLKVGIIASGIHLREKGYRPPKALHCSGGKMRIDVCIYMEEDRWMLEEAFQQYTGKANGW